MSSGDFGGVYRKTPEPLIDFALFATSATYRFFHLDAAQFALGNVPPFAADGAKDTVFGNGFTKTLEQGILRFSGT